MRFGALHLSPSLKSRREEGRAAHTHTLFLSFLASFHHKPALGRRGHFFWLSHTFSCVFSCLLFLWFFFHGFTGGTHKEKSTHDT